MEREIAIGCIMFTLILCLSLSFLNYINERFGFAVALSGRDYRESDRLIAAFESDMAERLAFCRLQRSSDTRLKMIPAVFRTAGFLSQKD